MTDFNNIGQEVAKRLSVLWSRHSNNYGTFEFNDGSVLYLQVLPDPTAPESFEFYYSEDGTASRLMERDSQAGDIFRADIVLYPEEEEEEERHDMAYFTYTLTEGNDEEEIVTRIYAFTKIFISL